MNRRTFLRQAAVTVPLPFLASMVPTRARAATVTDPPKRLLVFHHPQGVVMSDWAPTGSVSSFTLPTLLAPLTRHQDRILVIAGVDNAVPSFNTAGNGHQNADTSLFTCATFQDPRASVLVPGGPSFEQVIADRMGPTPFSRLDFGIGGGVAGFGLEPSPVFWHAAADPVVTVNDPSRMLNTLFASATLSPEALAAQQARRASVLDAVLQQFDAVRAVLPPDDQARLDAHAEKVRELEARVTSSGALACSAPPLSLPGDYNFGFDDDLTSDAMIELLVAALACDQARVATFSFLSGHDPTFPWLTTSSGGPVVPTEVYDNWHAMVHDGRDEEGLRVGFTWYAEVFAALLDRMAATVDVDGDNLLDTTTVVWASEFGNGAGHNTLKIPVVLAGNVGPLGPGRYLDYLNGGPNADWTPSDHHLGELFVALLQWFGGGDNTFGHTHPTLAPGPLPGILT